MKDKKVYKTRTETINHHPCACMGPECECTCKGPLTFIYRDCTNGWTYIDITCACGFHTKDCAPTGVGMKENN
jgi:hypothetical protein